jgi:hypothetical protein
MSSNASSNIEIRGLLGRSRRTIPAGDADWKITPKRWKWRARTAPHPAGLHSLIIPAPGTADAVRFKSKNADHTAWSDAGGVPLAVRFTAGGEEWAGNTKPCRMAANGGTLICR